MGGVSQVGGVSECEAVVLVRLREKKAQEARCLEDLLPCDATTNMKELLAAIGECLLCVMGLMSFLVSSDRRARST